MNKPSTVVRLREHVMREIYARKLCHTETVSGVVERLLEATAQTDR